jgi:hypothetical protein
MDSFRDRRYRRDIASRRAAMDRNARLFPAATTDRLI